MGGAPEVVPRFGYEVSMPVSGFKQYDYFDTVFRNSKGKEK